MAEYSMEEYKLTLNDFDMVDNKSEIIMTKKNSLSKWKFDNDGKVEYYSDIRYTNLYRILKNELFNSPQLGPPHMEILEGFLILKYIIPFPHTIIKYYFEPMEESEDGKIDYYISRIKYLEKNMKMIMDELREHKAQLACLPMTITYFLCPKDINDEFYKLVDVKTLREKISQIGEVPHATNRHGYNLGLLHGEYAPDVSDVREKEQKRIIILPEESQAIECIRAFPTLDYELNSLIVDICQKDNNLLVKKYNNSETTFIYKFSLEPPQLVFDKTNQTIRAKGVFLIKKSANMYSQYCIRLPKRIIDEFGINMPYFKYFSNSGTYIINDCIYSHNIKLELD